MARQADIDNWFVDFAKKLSGSVISLDLRNKEDVERIRFASQNKTQPLFQGGFEDTPENRKKIYDYAKEGKLFAFSKKDDKAYQMTANQKRECTAMDVGRDAEPEPVPPESPGFIRNLLNILTLGLFGSRWSKTMKQYKRDREDYKKKIKAFEKKNGIRHVNRFEKIMYKAFGAFSKRNLDLNRACQQTDMRAELKGVLEAESSEWKQRSEQIRKQEMQSKQDEKADKTREKVDKQLKELQDAKTNGAQADRKEKYDVDAASQNQEELLLVKGDRLQSQFNDLYEELKDVMAKPEGWKEYAGKVQDMGKIMKEIEDNPNLKEACGKMYEKMSKRYEAGSRMLEIHENGLKAKRELLDYAKNPPLTPDEKNKYIKDTLKASLMENCMVNDALGRKHLRERNVSENSLKDRKTTMDRMAANRMVFEEKFDILVNDMELTKSMQKEPPQDLAKSVSDKTGVYAFRQAQKMMSDQQKMMETFKKKKGPNRENREHSQIKTGLKMQIQQAEKAVDVNVGGPAV